jgi:hypothetical protein
VFAASVEHFSYSIGPKATVTGIQPTQKLSGKGCRQVAIVRDCRRRPMLSKVGSILLERSNRIIGVTCWIELALVDPHFESMLRRAPNSFFDNIARIRTFDCRTQATTL